MKIRMNCVYGAIVALATLGAGAVLSAQSPFDGTWRIDAKQTKFTSKPITFYTSGGWHHCVSCVPALDVAADGQDHAVQGQPFDTANVAVVNANTLKLVTKKDGKTTTEMTVVVSADGKTLTSTIVTYPKGGQAAVHETDTFKRVGKLPPGVHATSGNWQSLKFTGSENDVQFTIKTDGDSLTMTDEAGDSYTAKFDGSDYPYKGSYGEDAVALKKIDAHTIEQTDKLKGKTLDVQKITVSSDGKKLTMVVHDALRDTDSTFVATKE